MIFCETIRNNILKPIIVNGTDRSKMFFYFGSFKNSYNKELKNKMKK